jgi:hypothetical protein
VRGLDLRLLLTNPTSSPLRLRVSVTETLPSAGGRAAQRRRTFTFRAVTRTLAPGANATVTVTTPRALKTALRRALRRRRSVVRRPRITVTNLGTGTSQSFTRRVTARRR